MDDLCTMCEAAPATTIWGFPVCQMCSDALDSTQAVLKEMEAEHPHLAELGQRVESSFRRFLAARQEDEFGRTEGSDG